MLAQTAQSVEFENNLNTFKSNEIWETVNNGNSLLIGLNRLTLSIRPNIKEIIKLKLLHILAQPIEFDLINFRFS